MTKRSARHKTKQTRKRPQAPPAEAISHAAGEVGSSAKKDGQLVFVLACFFLSGVAALLYETAWLRLFSNVLGTSEIAVTTVLAAYMAGLGLGAGIAAKYVNRVKNTLLAYGLLEAGIALAALSVPVLVTAAGALYASMLGGRLVPPDAHSVSQPVFYLVAAFLILAVPTGLMGATLPLLAKHRSRAHVGEHVAILYGMNTAGAVFGTLLTAFILLPAIGLAGTVWIGVAINVCVFLLVAALVRAKPLSRDSHEDHSFRSASADGNPAPAVSLQTPNFSRYVVPAIVALSGATAFAYEVLWTRLLSHVLGGSVYAFATMLATFLSGIALGSAVAARLCRTPARSAHLLAYSQVGVALLSMLIYSWLEQFSPDQQGLYQNATLAIAVMLPATIFLGATFPFAVNVMTTERRLAGSSTGLAYAWNTAGAIVGAVVAGFFAIPILGFEGTIKVAVLCNLLLAIAVSVLVARRQWLSIAAIVVIAIVTTVVFRPVRPDIVTRSSLLADLESPGREIYYGVGLTSTVLLFDQAEWFRLQTNGLPEAAIQRRGAPPNRDPQKWLTALPVLARSGAMNMLVIGFGGGVSIESVPRTVDIIDVVEIEEHVVRANQAIAEARNIDPLSDPRINVIRNDARNALALSAQSYDAIVSQPSHPWTAGASHLFTREFFALAKERLTPHGVFLQWMHSSFLDEHLLGNLAATLKSTFRFVRLYQPNPGELLFLASDAPLEIERSALEHWPELADRRGVPLNIGLSGAHDVIAALLLDDDGVDKLAAGYDPSSDDYNAMAMRSRSSGDGLSPVELDAIVSPYDPLRNSDSWLFKELGAWIDWASVARSMLRTSVDDRVADLRDTVLSDATRAMIEAMRLEAAGRTQEADAILRSAVRSNPTHASLVYSYVRNHLHEFASGTTSAELNSMASRLDGAPSAVVEGWMRGGNGDWLGIARLEPLLAKAAPTDAWFREASILRAQWRTQLVAPGREEALLLEALRIVDRALAIVPSLDLYSLRALVALLMSDSSAFIESASVAVSYIDTRLQQAERGEYFVSEIEGHSLTSRLQELHAQLRSDFVAGNRERAGKVATRALAALERLAALP